MIFYRRQWTRLLILSSVTRTVLVRSFLVVWELYVATTDHVLRTKVYDAQLEESGRLCLYLASDATFTTGAEHLITGGAELAYGNKNQRKKVEGGPPPIE